MKKLITINLLLALTMPVLSFAATPAGLTPKSPFYFLDTLFERIGLSLTFNAEKKAEKAIEYANERLAEAEEVATEQNTDAVKTALSGYEKNIAFAAEESKQVKDKDRAEGVFNLIADNAAKQQEVLANVLAKVPDEAKEAIEKALEASKKGQEEAHKQIAELKGEVEQLKQEVAELKKQQKVELPTQSTEIKELRKELEELRRQKTEKTDEKQIVPVPALSVTPAPEPKLMSSTNVNESSSVNIVPPQTSTKTLKVNSDKPEIWATGFHYANLNFEYLVNNKPVNTDILLKDITPAEPVPVLWQRKFSVDQKFSYSTKVPGIHTLKFITDTGVENEIGILAKEWPNKQKLEIIPVQTRNAIEVPVLYNRGTHNLIIPRVLLGSFKIRTNPDINIKIYDCNLSTSPKGYVNNGIFESFTIETINIKSQEKNNCFTKTLYTQTDSTGLSKDEFFVYLNNLKFGSRYFYLNELLIRETEINEFRQADSSIQFNLEMTIIPYDP